MEPCEVKNQFPRTISYLVSRYGWLGVSEEGIVSTSLHLVSEKNLSVHASMCSIVDAVYKLAGDSRLTPIDVLSEIFGMGEARLIFEMATHGGLERIIPS